MMSALGWAPSIPAHWKVVPLGFVARMGTGHTPDRTKAEYWQDCTIPWVTTPDVTRRADSLAPLMDTDQKISEIGMANSAAVLHPAGTVMLSRTASVGYSVLIGRSMATTQAFATWHAGPLLDPRYLLLVLRAMKSEWERLAYGSTHLTIYMPDLESIRIPLPPIEEQRRIADFLDAETARLDELISLRNKQVEMLFEALCSEAERVTGRCDYLRRPDWRRVALRRVVDKVQTGMTPTEFLKSDVGLDHIPWYTPAALGGALDLSNADKGVHIEDMRHAPRFPAKSILIVGIGESLGKVADLDHNATGNQQLTAIRACDSVDRRFLAWQLFAAQGEIRSWAQYSRIRILNNDVLKSFMVMIPPITRQVASRKDLDGRLDELKDFRAAATRFSLLASERRQALITAAVTGQIDVTTARGVASDGGGGV